MELIKRPCVYYDLYIYIYKEAKLLIMLPAFACWKTSKRMSVIKERFHGDIIVTDPPINNFPN